jgi:hypothetical protein
MKGAPAIKTAPLDQFRPLPVSGIVSAVQPGRVNGVDVLLVSVTAIVPMDKLRLPKVLLSSESQINIAHNAEVTLHVDRRNLAQAVEVQPEEAEVAAAALAGTGVAAAVAPVHGALRGILGLRESGDQ